MRAIDRMFGLALAVCALSTPAWADALAGDPGLWEIATNTAGLPAGAIPQMSPDQLAKLPPQMRAMVEQKLAAAAGPHSTTRKGCVTQAMIDKGLEGPASEQKHCTRTPVSSSSTLMAFKMICTGDHPATGTVNVAATDRHTVESTVDMTVTAKEGMTVPIHQTMQGHWLGTDCGDVKPPAQ